MQRVKSLVLAAALLVAGSVAAIPGTAEAGYGRCGGGWGGGHCGGGWGGGCGPCFPRPCHPCGGGYGGGCYGGYGGGYGSGYGGGYGGGGWGGYGGGR